MGCRPRNAVWSGMQSLKKTQQKTRLSFNAEMSMCAAAPGPSMARGSPRQPGVQVVKPQQCSSSLQELHQGTWLLRQWVSLQPSAKIPSDSAARGHRGLAHPIPLNGAGASEEKGTWGVRTAGGEATTSEVWDKPHAKLEKGLFTHFCGPAWRLGLMAQQTPTVPAAGSSLPPGPCVKLHGV